MNKNKKEEYSNLIPRWTKQVKLCPRCKREFNGYPALSRSDNKTPICSNCGTEESMWEFSLLLLGKNNNKAEKILNKLFLLDVLMNNSNYITKKHFLKIKNQLMDVKY